MGHPPLSFSAPEKTVVQEIRKKKPAGRSPPSEEISDRKFYKTQAVSGHLSLYPGDK